MRKALIVDDSKTARRALCLLLERAGFTVDMLESAEEALEYLDREMPDLVFMDHLMPGMDGFQAVKVIKSNPRTEPIPIIMYTAREGEVYFGQAHALGAADILTKPARAADLAAVLERLEAKAKTAAADAVVPVVEVTPVEQPADAAPATNRPASVENEPPVEPAPLSLVVTSDPPPFKRSAAPAGERAPGEAMEDGASGRRGWWRPAALVVLALVPAIWLLGLYLPMEERIQWLQEREGQLYRTLEWSLNQSGYYPWGTPAMSGLRLENLQGLVSQLSALGYRGEIHLKVHVGDFCLVEDGQGGWKLAPPEIPVTDCGALGLSAADAMALSEYQGSAYIHFIEESPLLADDRIRIEWAGQGSAHPRVDYPLNAEQMNAGSWNAIAARNHRIEWELLPQTAAPAAPGESL